NAKTTTPAFATGDVSEANTPTSVKGIDPATRRQRQPRSQTTPSGTTSWRQTTESSSVVRVTEKRSPVVAHVGNGDPIDSLQTANKPATPSSMNRGVTKEWSAASSCVPLSRL